MQIGEEKLTIAEAFEIRLDRLLDLDDHVRFFVDRIGVGQDLRAGCFVFVVRKTAAVSGARLDADLVTIGAHDRRTRGRHPDTIFVCFDFGGYADAHRARIVAQTSTTDDRDVQAPALAATHPAGTLVARVCAPRSARSPAQIRSPYRIRVRRGRSLWTGERCERDRRSHSVRATTPAQLRRKRAAWPSMFRS